VFKIIYLVVTLIFFSIWAVLGSIFSTFFNKEEAIDKLKYFEENYDLKDKLENHKKNNDCILKGLSNLVSNTKLSGIKNNKLKMELTRADMAITVEELAVIKIILAVILAVIGFAFSKEFILGILIFILAWNTPAFIIAGRKKKRIKEFDSQLNEGIMIISNGLKAGYSFLQAVASTSEETKDPFSKEFKKLFKEMSLGISEEDALRNLQSRMSSEDLKLITNAILIQKDIGGNLSEILDNIADTIRERQKIKEELKTLTAQGKMSGIIVMLIPIGLGLAIYLINKDYMMLLFSNTIGILMISAAVISQIFGLLLIKKIIHIDM
jgi:tight adherence protein B